MSKTHLLLVLAALYLKLVHSWDIAVSVGNQLIFYTDGIKTNTVDLISHNATALAYDEVHNMMLYVDTHRDSETICSYNLFSKENKCFFKRVNSNISSIAFDPPTDTLFFTDAIERSINWISLKPGFDNNGNGNLLIRLGDQFTIHIAVDSCRGYIYWVNSDNKYNYIQRARFNGSERKNIYEAFPLSSMTIDTQTRNIYFIDIITPLSFTRKGLDDKVEDYFFLKDTSHSNPRELTVSNRYLYWMNSSVSYTSIWQMPKSNMKNEEIKEISKFYSETPVAIAANYKLKDQIQGRQDCEALSNIIPTTTGTGNSPNVQDTTETEQTTESTTLVEPFCVNGIKVSETSECKCTPGYIGGKCDVSVCENYCLQGDCSFNHEGLPKCRCNAGYSGERCEVYACHGFCLNNGDCTLNEEDQPVCQCVGNHEGTRCEVAINDVFTNTRIFDFLKRNLTLADYCRIGEIPLKKFL